jgi:hypothetical protein
MAPRTILWTAVITFGLCATASSAGLEAGVAVVEITPPLGYRMSGYFHERLATGVKDPLKAKAMVLRQGDQRAAMVFCDIIGVPLWLSTEAREQAEAKTGIPAWNILVAATHSHTGPLYYGAMRNRLHQQAVDRDGKDPSESVDYATKLTEWIVKAITEAQAAMVPVTHRSGVAHQQGLSFNRRFFMKDGSVRFNPGVLNPNIVKPCGPIDPEVGILLVADAETRRPLASLTVFALHLDTVGGTQYSADYPFYLEKVLQQELGDRFVSMFGVGTCGDINHIDVTRRERLKTQEIGETLGTTVKRRLGELPETSAPSLAVVAEVVQAPLQKYTDEEVAWAESAIEKVAIGEVPFLERVKAYKIMAIQLRESNSLPLPVQVFRLDAETAIVALSGEVFVDLGLAIKRASPFATTLVIELAHDAPGYIPTRKAFSEGSYETVNSRIEPGGGEKVVETAVRLLNQLKSGE